jgi:septal ring factor EnvC (AmiA/AmiB activator)
MGDPTITCPNCHCHIPLTESLAAPLLAATRRDYERRIADKDKDIADREEALRHQLADLEKAQSELDRQVLERVKAERARIATEETEKAKRLAAADLDQKTARASYCQKNGYCLG